MKSYCNDGQRSKRKPKPSTSNNCPSHQINENKRRAIPSYKNKNKKKLRHMMLKIQISGWNGHTNVAGRPVY